MVGTIIAILLIATLYEALKTLRDFLMYIEMKKLARVNSQAEINKESTPLLLQNGGNPLQTRRSDTLLDKMKRTLRQYISPLHIIQSLLYVVQVGMAYMLMLIAMSYNGWLYLAVCFGAGIGYYLFGACRSGVFGDQSDNCH